MEFGRVVGATRRFSSEKHEPCREAPDIAGPRSAGQTVEVLAFAIGKSCAHDRLEMPASAIPGAAEPRAKEVTRGELGAGSRRA
jgi:hypothetical protein